MFKKIINIKASLSQKCLRHLSVESLEGTTLPAKTDTPHIYQFKALGGGKAWHVWSLQTGFSRNLPFNTASFSLDRLTLLMPHGVCRMNVQWSVSSACRLYSTSMSVCYAFIFLTELQWHGGDGWDFVLGGKCDRNTTGYRQNKQTWNV